MEPSGSTKFLIKNNSEVASLSLILLDVKSSGYAVPYGGVLAASWPVGVQLEYLHKKLYS